MLEIVIKTCRQCNASFLGEDDNIVLKVSEPFEVINVVVAKCSECPKGHRSGADKRRTGPNYDGWTGDPWRGKMKK